MRRPDLVPDCGSCAGVCCVAPSFEASEDFAFDKPAGTRCPNLQRDHRCAIHAELTVRGFSGCAIYDCHGAGQRATRAFSGEHQESERNEAFLVLRAVCELLWLATEAVKLCPGTAADVARGLEERIRHLDAIAGLGDAALFEVDLKPHRDEVQRLARRIGDALGGRTPRRTALRVLR